MEEKYNITGCIKSNSVHNFIWEVDNFTHRSYKEGNCTYSPISDNILVKNNGLRMKMVPLKPDNSSSVFRFLVIRNDKFFGLEVFKLTFSNINGEIFKEKSFKGRSSSYHSRICAIEDIFMDNILNNKIKLVNDTLRISCFFNINPKIIDMSGKNIKSDDSDLASNICSLSDVTVTVGKKKFEVHKAILSNKSRVFSAMFNHDVQESNKTIIEIKDVQYDVMKEVIRFIYCDKVENLQKFPNLLLEAADKFDLKELKAVCERFLQKNVSIPDCCEMLQIAHSYNCENLKNTCIDFIAVHLNAIIELKDFEKLTKFSKYLRAIIKKSLILSKEENRMIVE